jgi:hypothetical protein
MLVFIACSREAKATLDLLTAQIGEMGHAPVTWNQAGLFSPGTCTLPRLIIALLQ